MINIQTIQHVSDCEPLYLPHSLYLKPVAKMHISVALPYHKTGKNISNLDIMEKLSAALKPDKFLVLKVSKSTVEFIRFEAELDDRSRLRSAISRLDGVSLKISGFQESFRVRAGEPKDEFPTRHDWDSYFRDASHMDEMKAGERPDTIHFTHLPIRWFCPRHAENDEGVKPSESIFRRIFEKFGSVRCVDIPICDVYRSKMNSDISGMKTFSFEQDVLFEAYVQFDEYVGFVRAMDDFRGMKLVRKFMDKTQAINIGVLFDKTKHLSEVQIQRRERVRKRLMAKVESEKKELEIQKKLELEKLEQERQRIEQLKLSELEKQREREEKRKEKHLKKIQEHAQVEISQKIRVEQRKLMIAQRKLESIRILEQLFDRIKLKHCSKHGATSRRQEENNLQRVRLVEKYKKATENLLNDQRQKVEDIKNNTPLIGLLKVKKPKHLSGASSDEDDKKAKRSAETVAANNTSLNPYKTMTPFPNLAAAAAAASAPGYNAEAATEWMKTLSMLPYVPQVFPSIQNLYRPPPPFPVSANYRGFNPRPIRARGRGRGRGRGGYDGTSSSSYYNQYKSYDDDYEGDEDGYHYKSSRSRRHYNKRSRSRSRSRSYSRSRSRSRRRSRRSTRSRSHSRSRSRSRSRSKSTAQRTNKKLVSTRRSHSTSDSRSRSRSRHRGSKRNWSRRDNNSRSHSRSHSRRTRSRSRTGVDVDKLVRSAEVIKNTIEKDTQQRMREEEREIKENFSNKAKHSTKQYETTTIIMSNSKIIDEKHRHTSPDDNSNSKQRRDSTNNEHNTDGETHKSTERVSSRCNSDSEHK